MTPTLYLGIVPACVAGLLLGAAMQPQLKVADGPDGPQMLSGVSGKRGAPGWDDVTLTGWNGPPPDYVVGTDWLRPPVYEGEVEAYERDFAYVDNEDPEMLPVVESPPPAWLVEASAAAEARATMPSEGGDILAGVGLPPPPEPPVETAEAAPSA